jgi:hypothetical protein
MVSGPRTSDNQAISMSADCTILLCLRWVGNAASRSGASSYKPSPSSHGSSQKSVEAPFLIVTATDALKNAHFVPSSRTGIEAHGLDGSVCCSHNHHNRRA